MVDNRKQKKVLASEEIQVTVIIPVYNNASGLHKTLNGLKHQDSRSGMEIFVVDNGSNDNPEQVVKGFQPSMTICYLEEHSYLNSPYSSRNRGIEKASGKFIALLDSTCVPVNSWLREGLKAMTRADLVGGAIEFDVDENSSTSEIFDSLTNANMSRNIESRGTAVAGNLFVRKTLFDKLGMFPEGLRSGGDIRWTKHATENGYKLRYSHEAKVLIKPKDFKGLCRKQYRVGQGHPIIWMENHIFLENFIKKILLSWFPPNPLRLHRLARDKKLAGTSRFLKLYMLGWYLRMVNGLGSMVGLTRLKAFLAE